MIKAHYDVNTQELLGWYNTDIHNEIQTPSVEVDISVWEQAINNQHNRVSLDGVTHREEKTFTLRELKDIILATVSTNYKIICEGKDPTTGKPIYVDCTFGDTTYRMNTGKDAATAMDSGVRIYERGGATHMPIVRDFNNTNHLNVPMDEAISISLQQGADAIGYWQQKGAMVDAINTATTETELDAVNLIFAVNTL